MMKILKRNQLIILVISLILVTAGYLNYTSDISDKNTVMTSEIIADLGDATLVNSKPSEAGNENAIEENCIEQNEIETSEDVFNLTENTQETAKVEDSYYTTSKLERESMYSELLETYQEIYNNQSSTAEQRSSAINEIANINKIKNSIMISENLIKTKGFEDVVIFVNSNSVSVVIKGNDLTGEQIAQVQNIVSREIGVEAEIIHISTK